MLTFNVNQHTITVEDAMSKAQDVSKVDAKYIDTTEYELSSLQLVNLYENDKLLKSVLLGSIGGGTGVSNNTAMLDIDRLVTCCSDTVFCLSVSGLDLLWKTKADDATCFAVYQYQQDYIVHGELEISRLDRQGNIIWSVSGADIFVTLKGDSDIVLLEDRIIAIDFENSKYEFDYDGNTLSYTKANV